MKRILNYFTIIISFLLILSGILKSFGMLKTIELNVFEMTISMKNHCSTFYILVVNFIGGFSMLYHSIKTINFQNDSLKNNSLTLENTNNEKDLKPLSNYEQLTGIISILISLWLILKTIFLLSDILNFSLEYFPLFIFAFLVYVPFSLLPLLLVGRNLFLNNKVSEIIEKERIKNIRNRIDSSDTSRRR